MGVVAGNRRRRKMAQAKQESESEIEKTKVHPDDGEKIFIPQMVEEKKPKSKKA